MYSITRDELIFWLDQPPKVGKGAFNYISKVWGNKVIYVCMHDFDEIRKMAHWDDGDFGNAEVIMLSDAEDILGKVEEVFRQYPNAIHVLGGFRSEVEKLIRQYIFKGDIKLTAFSERPGIYGKPFIRFLKFFCIPVLHRYIALKYKKKISAYMPLGTKGVNLNLKYGWEKSILFPFMYDPIDYSCKLDSKIIGITHEPIKLLYVGRFSKFTKGTDILIKAINKIKGENWVLDMVGGYGDLKDDTIEWANNHLQVSFQGTWPSTEVCCRMKEYDVCIIPSRFDGWNLIVNEAIRANIAVIVSDEAVSDEMISVSGSGIVVPACDVTALANAIQTAIDNPDLVELWKQKAKKYSPRISSETVGNYFIDIMDYTFYNTSMPRPECPWIDGKEK